jgi:GxxExxY protein
MHPLFQKASGLTESIIAAAIEVHRDKGPGLIESIYEWCMLQELGLRGLLCASQKIVIIEYKGFSREEPLRFDILVEGCVLVEIKAAEKVLPIHKAQLLSYMKLLDVPLGLLINFHEMRVIDGVSRLIQPFPQKSGHRILGLRERKHGSGEKARAAISAYRGVQALRSGPMAQQRQNIGPGGTRVWDQPMERAGLESAVWTYG